LKGGALIAKTSLNAENYVDAVPYNSMLCRHVSFSHDHNPISSNLRPDVTNLLQEFDGGWSRGQLQFKKGRIVRTSPGGYARAMPFAKLQGIINLDSGVRFRFNRPPWTESATSPSYNIETWRSLMRWKANDESCLLVLVPPPEDFWIILSVHDNMLCHQFHALAAFVSCVGP
jgi:hypothetical protein